MTLIIGFVSRHGVWQVSDRLVTEQATGRVFDAFANKTVLYICLDAIVAIGYTGVAFIRDRPTDEWIAEQLIGRKIDTRLGIGMGASVERRNIISALELLRTGLDVELYRIGKPQFGLLVTGWKWAHRKSKMPTPFIAEMKWAGGHLTTAIPPRYWWYWQRGGLVWCPDLNMPAGSPEEVMANIKKCRTVPCISNALVDAVRLIAKTNNTVGENCMTISLPPPQNVRAEIEFVPQAEHSGVIKNRVTGEVRKGPFPVAYSPWIVGPAFVSPPAVMVNGWNFFIGPWHVSVNAPQREAGGLLAALSSQVRPQRPK